MTIPPFTSVVLIEKGNYSLLPLRFLDFAAKQKDIHNELSWTISNEINLQHFEIKRSSNGSSFELVGNMPFENGIQTYRFNDNKSFVGKTYYRIAGKHIDGEIIYSKIVMVSTIQTIALDIFPNPAIHYLDVRFKTPTSNSSLSLSIKNLQGVVIKNYPTISSAQNLSINTSSLTPGLNFLSITDNKNITINKQFIEL